MNIKQLLTIFATTVFVLSLSPLSYAAVTEGNAYAVTMLRYEPVPAQPGSIMEAWIQVTNLGRLPASSTSIVIDPAYPFTPASAQDAQVNIGQLASGSTFVTRIRLSVDSAAGDGNYLLPVKVTNNGRDFVTTDLTVQVRSPSAVLSVESAQTEPREISPGQKAKLLVTVHNTQANTLRDVSVSLDLQGSSLTTVGTTSQQTMARIEGGAKQTFVFDLIADPQAASGIVRLPVTFNFMSASGETITQTEYAGVIIHSQPDITVLTDRVTLDASSGKISVLVRVVNKGLSQVKFAELTIDEAQGYKLAESRNTVYVGNIDSDDFQTAEYSITTDEKQFTLQGTLTYRDALNEQFSVPVSLSVNAPAQAKKGISPLVWLIIIVVIIAAVVYFRRKKKKQ